MTNQPEVQVNYHKIKLQFSALECNIVNISFFLYNLISPLLEWREEETGNGERKEHYIQMPAEFESVTLGFKQCNRLATEALC